MANTRKREPPPNPVREKASRKIAAERADDQTAR